jgi:hypothetical protein
MTKKKLILFSISLIFLTGYFLLPPNRDWGKKIISYWADFRKQKDRSGREARMTERFENDYTFSSQIARYFQNRNDKQHILLLMPPTSYFNRMGIKYHVPEPAVFYYYTGLKTIWADSKEAINVKWYVRVNAGKIIVDSVTDKKSLQDSIAAFKRMGVSL